MLFMHSVPRVEPDPQYGWQVVFWLGEAFDYDIPFRAALAEMVEALQMEAPARIELPPCSSGEDSVEGSLVFGEVRLKTYFEYSLGYLALMSAERDALEIVTEKLLPLVRVRSA